MAALQEEELRKVKERDLRRVATKDIEKFRDRVRFEVGSTLHCHSPYRVERFALTRDVGGFINSQHTCTAVRAVVVGITSHKCYS